MESLKTKLKYGQNDLSLIQENERLKEYVAQYE